MGQSMLPILVLTTVALSASDVLPILSDNDKIQSYNMDKTILYQKNYNIFNKIYNKRKNYISEPPLEEISDAIYANVDNGPDSNDLIESSNKEENYDDEGYRKEQWHNYPRQLDRLQKFHYKHNNFIETPKFESDNKEQINSHIDNFATNEFRLRGDRNVYNSVIPGTNPFLIFKVQLAYLRNDITNNDPNEYPELWSFQSENKGNSNEKTENFLYEVIEPESNKLLVKREKSNRNRDNEIFRNDSSGFETGTLMGKKTVKKRLFSLWSRLQGLTHRGHELHHRRHLHAFYGSPENNGNGVLTAQTRATFVRPPGSPLRWG